MRFIIAVYIICKRYHIRKWFLQRTIVLYTMFVRHYARINHEKDDIDMLIEHERTTTAHYKTSSSRHQINSDSRKIVVEWLREICRERYFGQDVCHLTAQICDDYIASHHSTVVISYANYQCLAISAIWIASKLLCEDNTPTQDLAFISTFAHKQFSADQIKTMELAIIDTLNGRCMRKTGMDWIHIWLDWIAESEKIDAKKIAKHAMSVLDDVLSDSETLSSFPHQRAAYALVSILCLEPRYRHLAVKINQKLNTHK